MKTAELPPEILAKFWAKVQPTGFCWEWMGAINSYGYGQFYIARPYSPAKAHRLAYEVLVGEIPEGMQLDHLCRNRACVNPDHLEPVTPRLNVLRGFSPARIGSEKMRCERGHEFTPENTYHHEGRRRCKKCRAARLKRWRNRQKEAA